MPGELDLRQLQGVLVALGIGLLIGLERERRSSAKAGLRTSALVALLGYLAAMLSADSGSVWMLAAGLLATGATLVVAYASQPDPSDPGTTTVVALLVCYCLGAAVWHGHAQLAVALGITTTVLLYFKAELRDITQRLTSRDLISMLQFAVLSLVILPVLPNRNFGPFDAINPHQVWLMVVLISGVSLAGYAALRLVGNRYGATAIGCIGGLVSSTATTLVFARRARANADFIATAMVVILLANLVMTLRLYVITAAVAPGVLPPLLFALLPGTVLGLTSTLLLLRGLKTVADLPVPEVRNPTEIRTALGFGAIYAIVLIVTAWLSAYAGDKGLYVAALISGLTDVDAITLSSLRLYTLQKAEAVPVVTAIALATLSNLAFKLGLTLSVGTPELARRTLPTMLLIAVGIGAGLAALRI